VNVETGTEAMQFPEKESINGIFHAVWEYHFCIADLFRKPMREQKKIDGTI
jgi:hypothetical protein